MRRNLNLGEVLWLLLIVAFVLLFATRTDGQERRRPSEPAPPGPIAPLTGVAIDSCCTYTVRVSTTLVDVPTNARTVAGVMQFPIWRMSKDGWCLYRVIDLSADHDSAASVDIPGSAFANALFQVEGWPGYLVTLTEHAHCITGPCDVAFTVSGPDGVVPHTELPLPWSACK